MEVAGKRNEPDLDLDGVRSFSRQVAWEIQSKLNATKPDITAAFVLATLLTWSNARSWPTKKRREAGAIYLSYEQIQEEELPWLSRKTIGPAAERLSLAYPEDFKLDTEKGKVSNFIISDRLKKHCAALKKEYGELSVRVGDVMKYGILKAVLIRHSKVKLSKERRERDRHPLRDTDGKVYAEISAEKLTQTTKEYPQPILPYSKDEVRKAIRELKTGGTFIEHLKKKGFFRLVEAPIFIPKATIGQGANEIVQGTNETVQGANETVYSVQIEDQIEAPIALTLCSHTVAPTAAPCANGETNTNTGGTNEQKSNHSLPLFLKDIFPKWIEEAERLSKDYRKWRDQNLLIHPISNDELFYDYIDCPFQAEWFELSLDINPLTEQPMDWSNDDEQIDFLLEILDLPLGEVGHTPEEINGFRHLFKEYPGLNQAIIEQMLEHIETVQFNDAMSFEEHPIKDSFDQFDYFFARRIHSLHDFVRFFEQLFLETFAPFHNDDGEILIDDDSMIRRWSGVLECSEFMSLWEFYSFEIDKAAQPFRMIYERTINEGKDSFTLPKSLFINDYDEVCLNDVS
jgi:hypothetical protein